MIRYTLGPWRHRNGIVFSGPVNRPLTITKVARAHDGDHSSANGNLIAAAPELFEALKLCVLMIEGRVGLRESTLNIYDVLDRSESAIRKAKGE